MFQQLDIAIAFVVVVLLLSLLVMAIVQAISALFDLRGKNLVRALADLLKQIDSGLNSKVEDDAKAPWWEKLRDKLEHPFTRVTLVTRVADAVAKHPVLAHTFTRAKSLRKEELIDILKDLCSKDMIGTIDPAAKERLQAILAAQVPGGAATEGTAQRMAAELAKNFPGLKDQMDRVLTYSLGSVSQMEVGVEKWFDTVMDRASDVFTRWTRTITILISVLLVVVLQIDAGLILKQVSIDPAVRAGLFKLSDTALTQADETLKTGNRGTATLSAIADQHSTDPAASDLRNAPLLVTCQQGKQWLEDYKSKHPTSTDFQPEFNDRCEELTAAQLRRTGSQMGSIRDDLNATNLTIVPEMINGEPVFGSPKSWLRAYQHRWHLLGTLAMVVLLSLGAPFWFNALKQLSNLKPSVTRKIEKEAPGTQS